MAAARIAEADARSLVERHLADADEVFVGRLLELERGQHPTVDDDGNEGRLSAFKVRLDPIHIIKGAPVPETIYTFERNDDVLHLGCSPLVGEDHISFDDGPGYRFIVYARSGTVLRAKLVVDWFDGLSSGAELEMIDQTLTPGLKAE